MKKIMMTLAAIAFAATMNAQVYVGGGIGFKSVSYDGESTTTFGIIPEVGYNLDENLAVGIAFGYAESGKDEHKRKGFDIAPYARYTFAKFDKVNLFLDGTFMYSHLDNAGAKTNAWGIGVKPGVAVNLNEKLSFVAKLGFVGFESSKPDVDGAKATNTFTIDLSGNGSAFNSNGLTFGLYYNF